MKFSHDTVKLLTKQGLDRETIDSLAWQVDGQRERRKAPTRKQVRAGAERVEKLADKLLVAMETFEHMPSTGDTMGTIRLVWPPLEPMVLRDQLERLQKTAQVLLDATGDDPDRLRLSLRERGPAPDPAATGIASATLWELHKAGFAVTDAEDGAAVECVQLVLNDSEVRPDIDARHYVRAWLSRNKSTELFRRVFGVRRPKPHL